MLVDQELWGAMRSSGTAGRPRLHVSVDSVVVSLLPSNDQSKQPLAANRVMLLPVFPIVLCCAAEKDHAA